MRRKINCRACIYYHVTWEPDHPHGCRAMNFKSTTLPSVEVYKASGVNCQFFKRNSHYIEKKRR